MARREHPHARPAFQPPGRLIEVEREPEPPDTLAEDLRQAREAAKQLADLQRQAAALPGLEREAERRKIEASAKREWSAMINYVSVKLESAIAGLAPLRAEFAALARQLEPLAVRLRHCQDEIASAQARLAEACAQRAFADLFEEWNGKSGEAYKGAMIVIDEAAKRQYGQSWPELGGQDPRLACFPDGVNDDPKLAMLAGLIAQLSERLLYNPKNAPMWPTQRPDN